jgi:hypothetical protein
VCQMTPETRSNTVICGGTPKHIVLFPHADVDEQREVLLADKSEVAARLTVLLR